MYLRRVIPGSYIYAVAANPRHCEVLDLFERTETDLSKQVLRDLQIVSAGFTLSGGRIKSLRDGIFELRKGPIRVLFFRDGRETIILTNGFLKKSQRTPVSELERATRYYQQYWIDKKRLSLEYLEES